MELKQNDLERLKDKMQRGELTAAEANVEMVRMMRVRLVTCRIPVDVRKALNAAVKSGHLGHMKKEGSKPEAYYHPTFDHLARSERRTHEEQTQRAVAGVLTRPGE